MNQQQLYRMFPDMDYEEMATVMQVTSTMSEQQQQHFLAIYQGRRKDQQQIILFCLLGFFGVSGVHRFVLGDIGLGILYLLTGGLCLIGTIVDLINAKSLASSYNRKQAYDAANIAKMISV
ncbi:MAG: TM2 domain-containing protein [Niabella sp.]